MSKWGDAVSIPGHPFFDRESGADSKVVRLCEGNRYDTCGPNAGAKEILGGIYNAKKERGVCRLFKTLYTNACSFDCRYCINTRKEKKVSYTPPELARTFIGLFKDNLVDGLFLSSAIPKDPETIMERMIETVEIVRFRYHFHGYVHMKILPGSSRDIIRRASGLAQRLSINLEAPNKDRLSYLSGTKDYRIDILRRQRWMKNMDIPHGHTTQFVVGAACESDFEILNMLDFEYRNLGLFRGYFSAFTPCRGTAFEKKERTSRQREVRLYNTDFLLRKYGFHLDEVKDILDDEGNLGRGDPKQEIARNYFDKAVDINCAGYRELLHVPGIGPRTAKNIMEKRAKEKIRTRRQLKEAGVILKRAEPFIKLNGWRQERIGGYMS